MNDVEIPKEVARWFTEPFNNMRTLKFKAQPTDAFFATVRRLFPASDNCRVRGYQQLTNRRAQFRQRNSARQ